MKNVRESRSPTLLIIDRSIAILQQCKGLQRIHRATVVIILNSVTMVQAK